ncbi:PE-PGRS family protein [Streptomyces tsukubensis]
MTGTGEQNKRREYDGDWDVLFSTGRPAEELRQSWADGIALRRHAPDGVFRRLVGVSDYLLCRDLPADAVEAALAHPDRRVRERAAEMLPGVTAEQWSRSIARTERERDRWFLVMNAAFRGARLTAEGYRQAAADPSARVRMEAARLPYLPAAEAVRLASDPHPVVRANACAVAWPHLSRTARQALLRDPSGAVRSEALVRHHQVHPVSRETLAADEGLAKRAVEECRLSRGLVEECARHVDARRRAALARNPHLPADLVESLGQDVDSGVRFTVSVRPDLTEEQRSRIHVPYDRDAHHYPLRWVMALHGDEDAMRRLASSSHFLVRRSVARARRLPPDVVERLAHDDDRVVHLFLAESCDDAPADLLLSVWRWWTGSFSHPGRPYRHPNFPRAGMLRYADDPEPRMRRLALDDPESTAELAERFGHDRAQEVRFRAAGDPRLSAASLERLLEDSDRSVRYAAVTNPALSVPVLVRLLLDPATAQDAARNPALPDRVVHRMTDLVRPPDIPGVHIRA